jgi:hypothetical protein
LAKKMRQVTVIEALYSGVASLHAEVNAACAIERLVTYYSALRHACKLHYTQTPLYEQVGQQVANLLTDKFLSYAPDTNSLYNLLADIFH